MKRSALRLLAAVSLLAAIAMGAVSPRYGGTLRIAVRAAPNSLDPASANQPDSVAWRNVQRLMFDSLVVLDERGQTIPALALSWQTEPGNQRWQFEIRSGVSFADGTPVTADAVAASLRAANPKWKVFSSGPAVIIECDAPEPKLAAELALPQYGIAKRDGGKLAGSGAFAVSHWEPGKKLALAAREDYWAGRAFADAVEVDLGSSFRDQLTALEVGKSDLIEIAPEQARRASAENHRVESSLPVELMALVFAKDPQPGDARLRQALALSIDRISMNEVLLQGGGEPAGGFLPNWMTGYAFVFPSDADLDRARLLRTEFHQTQALTLGYDAGDPLARVIAERIVLNAKDVGISLQLSASPNADLQLVRLPLASLDVQVSLSDLAARLGLPQPRFAGDFPSDIYAAENALLQTQRVIPLLHLRSSVGLGPHVRNLAESRDGSWHLPDVWLAVEKP